MELKLSTGSLLALPLCGSNRTFMELKLMAEYNNIMRNLF